MPKVAVSPGQIWQDDCYYLDTQTGECRRKFLLILATDGGGDAQSQKCLVRRIRRIAEHGLAHTFHKAIELNEA